MTPAGSHEPLSLPDPNGERAGDRGARSGKERETPAQLAGAEEGGVEPRPHRERHRLGDRACITDGVALIRDAHPPADEEAPILTGPHARDSPLAPEEADPDALSCRHQPSVKAELLLVAADPGRGEAEPDRRHRHGGLCRLARGSSRRDAGGERACRVNVLDGGPVGGGSVAEIPVIRGGIAGRSECHLKRSRPICGARLHAHGRRCRVRRGSERHGRHEHRCTPHCPENTDLLDERHGQRERVERPVQEHPRVDAPGSNAQERHRCAEEEERREAVDQPVRSREGDRCA